jgi:response regulator RpfG family c-di-GMP phosphodiesterase
MHPHKILFVDDDKNILNSFRRNLRKEFIIEIADDGVQGLNVINQKGPFAVVVSDLRMPGMDGIKFLTKVREFNPDTVRILLTGFADVQSAISAVNQSNIYRLLSKPCSAPDLLKTLKDAVAQYRLIISERELLEKTLRGSIRVLTELLTLLNPEAFGRTTRIQRNIRDIGLMMAPDEVWRFEMAAMLSQIGCVTLPPEAIRKLYHGNELSDDDAIHFKRHPAVGSGLIENIPRMKEVALIVAYQEKHFDGSGIPQNDIRGKDIPLGARILKVALDYDLLEAGGNSKDNALQRMGNRSGWYDPQVFDALKKVLKGERKDQLREVMIYHLNTKMILAADVKTVRGLLLVGRGQPINSAIIERLKNFDNTHGIELPIKVWQPLDKT